MSIEEDGRFFFSFFFDECVCVCFFYHVDPVIESRDSGEDSGFLLIVAAKARDKAGNAVHLPNTFSVLAVQRATRVTLET